MSTLHNLKGCGTALVTPFQPDGKIDVIALERLVDFQIKEGINFLVPCGTTGESATQILDDQLLVVDTVLKRVNRKVPVIAGAGGNNTLNVIETAKEMEALGVDGLLSVAPYYNKPTQEGLFQHYRTISESVHIPIIIYNVPGRTSSNLLPDTVVRLAEIENIIGIKEASGNISQISELAIKIPDEFKIISGDDANTLPMIALGGVGVISVIANEVPKMMTEFVNLCLNNNFKSALSIQRKLFPLMKANFIETNPIPVKAALSIMGFIEEFYRLPLVPMGKANKDKLRTVLKEMGLV
jgi:4-hydroxy-tetrahydrodipicolinate synthase